MGSDTVGRADVGARDWEGLSDGLGVGADVGDLEGSMVGLGEGVADGAGVGDADGFALGAGVGTAVGSAVGDGDGCHTAHTIARTHTRMRAQ